MTTNSTIDPKTLEKFITEVLQLEKRYAHDLKGATKERRSKILEKVNETAGRELDQA